MFDTSTPFDSTTPFDPTRPSPPPAPAPPAARPMRASANALPPGTCLGEFEIVRVIGSGGFGIVYLANDRLLLRQVAIKEYLPATLAGRREGQTVVVHHESAGRSFAAGLASFLNEAQLLARFDHPALVKVYRFWRANDTAYMAMPYYLGRTLKDERLAMHGAPSETWLRGIAEPLLSALDLLHGEGVFHRDVSPDNIMVRPDGRPVLLDFGSARRAIGERTRMLTVLVKPNFAPVEQYGDDTSLRQGPWTDLYAFGATLRFALTGQAPTPSVIRAVRDELAPLASASLTSAATGAPEVSPLFLAAIDWALTVAPEARPQNVAALRQVLRGEAGVPLPGAANDEGPRRSRWPRAVLAGTAAALVALAVAGGAAWVASRERVAPVTVAPTLAATPAPAVTTAPAPAQATEPEAMVKAAAAAAPIETPRTAAVAPPAATTATVAPRPPPRRKHSETPQPRPPATTAAVAPASAKAGAGGSDSCAQLGFFRRQLCMARLCARPEAQGNPQCAERRRSDDERLRRTQQ